MRRTYSCAFMMTFVFWIVIVFLGITEGDPHVLASGTVTDWYRSGNHGDQPSPNDIGELPSSIRPPASQNANTPQWWSVLMSFLTVLALIVVLAYLVRRFGLIGSMRGEQRLDVKVLYVIPLGGKRSIQVVQIGTRLYVLGIADTIHVLDRLTLEEAQDLFRQHDAISNKDERPNRSFAEELEQLEMRFRDRWTAFRTLLAQSKNPPSADDAPSKEDKR